jgi:hypothetical protein
MLSAAKHPPLRKISRVGDPKEYGFPITCHSLLLYRHSEPAVFGLTEHNAREEIS